MWPYSEAEQHWLAGGSAIASDSVDAVPDIIERHGMRRTYLLADAMTDAIVRLVAILGRRPTPHRPPQSERDTAGRA